MPVLTDTYLKVVNGQFVASPGTWLQFRNNSTLATYVSAAAADGAGIVLTPVLPSGSYLVATGPTNIGPWTPTTDTAYLVPTAGQADTSFPMAGPDPWFDITHPSFAGGAKVNGVADDLPSINAAGAAANAVGGGWVLVPNLGLGPALYAIGGGTLNLYSNTTLMGLGAGAGLKKMGACSLYGTNLSAARISNLNIDFNFQGFDGIQFGPGSSFCVVEECSLRNPITAGAAIKLAGGTGHIIRHNWIFGPAVFASAGAGVYVIGPTTNSQIVNNYILNVGTATASHIAIGPGVPGCNGNLVLGNICVNNIAGYGITVAIGSFYNKVHSNHCSGMGISGILANGDRTNTKNNTCLNNGLDGIDLGDSSNSICEGNFCGLNMWHGIEVNADISNSLGLLVKDNICWANNQTNNSSDGIRVQANPSAGGLVSQCVFMGNRCYDDQGVPRQAYGIRELQGPGTVNDNLYIGNSLRGNVTSALLISGASSRSVANLGAADNRTIQNIAYAAAITPDASLAEIIIVGTLTASMTVNAPLNPLKGQRLTFIFTQNAAGGWLVSWNAVFLTSGTPWISANATTVMNYMYDGTNWRLEGLPVSTGSSQTAYLAGAIISSGFMQTFGQMLVGTNVSAGTQIFPGELSTSAQQTTAGLWRVAGVPSNANGNNSDRAFQDSGVTWVKKSGVWLTETSVIVAQTQPANPAATASLVGVMMGLGQTITPNRSGKIKITITGDAFNTVATDGTTVQIRQGTGGAPANGVALTGTALGSNVQATSATASAKVPFCVTAIVSGLALGTTIWVDVGVAAVVAGNAAIESLNVLLEEV